jgi:ribosome-binding protein aMBF1 (putative translation factor)
MKSKCFFCGKTDQTVLEEFKLSTETITLCGNCARKLEYVMERSAVKKSKALNTILQAFPKSGQTSIEELKGKLGETVYGYKLTEIVEELMEAGVIYMPRKNYIARV